MREFFYKITNKIKKYKKFFVKENLIINEKEQDTNKEKDKDKKIIDTNKKDTSIFYQNNKRLLALKNTDCALVMHDEGQCEVIFTKFRKEDQEFTSNEELLMALAIFLKQPGFGDMLISEFNRVAINNSNKMFKNNQDSDE